jgi:hypothetical protein
MNTMTWTFDRHSKSLIETIENITVSYMWEETPKKRINKQKRNQKTIFHSL